MAFVGNDMFGHGMTHHPSTLVQSGTGFGQGHGSGGFGSSSQTGGFGQGGLGSSGFGQGTLGGSNSAMNPNQPFFHRQNSLLTDMTHSKTDPKPVYVNQFTQSQVRHEDQIYSNMYEKPLEKPTLKPQTTQERRKTLQRQKSVSIPDDFDRPPKLGPRTRSLSLSMYDDSQPMKPMNMDIAQPILRRSNTVSAKSDKTHNKHKFLRPLSIGRRFRKRSDSRSSQSSTEPPRSEPPRSSKYHEEIETNDRPTKTRSSEIPQSSKSDDEHAHLILSLMNPPSSPDTDTNLHYSPFKKSDQLKKEIPNDEVIESPTSVRRRFQQVKPSEQDNLSMTSGRSTPKSVHVISTPSLYRTLTIETPARRETISPTQSPSHSPVPEKEPKAFNNFKPDVTSRQQPPKYQRSDSENSDTFYDCDNPGEFKRMARKEHGDRKKGKRKPQADKPRTHILSTGTNTDDEASNPNTPNIISNGNNPFQEYDNSQNNNINPEDQGNNQYDDSTLCVRELIDTFNRKATENSKTETPPSPTLKHVNPDVRDLIASMSFAKNFDGDNEDQTDSGTYLNHPAQFNHSPSDTYTTRLPDIVMPKFESVLKGQEPTTADSSESGYTSNLQNSPRDYELKAAHYVNSLPLNTDLDNRKSIGSDLVRAGSQTDSDNESELSEVPCRSGSDTDYQLSDSETHEEPLVMKILESPSDVAQRVTNQVPVKERTHHKQASTDVSKNPQRVTKTAAPAVHSSAPIVHSPNSPFMEKRSSLKNKNREKSNDSETELKHLHITEPKTTKVVLETQPNNSSKTETVIVHPIKPGSSKASGEGRHVSKKSTPSFAPTLLDLPLLGFRKRELSSVAQTQCTNCLDSLLHILNVLLFISSGGVVAVGMWLLLKEFNVNHIAEIFGNNIIQVIMYVAVGGAALALLATMCLCCGVRRDKFGLGFYASVLVIVVLALGTAAVLCTIFADKLKGIEFKLQFKDRLITKYGNTENTPMENKFFTESWDKMQQEFKCCGADGNVNDTTSWAVYKKFSAWFKLQPDTDRIYHFVPESCCAPNSNAAVCMGSDHKLYGPPVYGPPMDRGFNTNNPNLNTDGCYTMVSGYLQQLITITALVTGGLAGLYFLVVMLTWVFCFKRRQDGDYDYSSYDYDDEVFDEEEDDEDEEEEAGEENAEETATNVIHPIRNATVENTDFIHHQASVHKLPSAPITDTSDNTAVETVDITKPNSGTILYTDNTINFVDRVSPVSEQEALDRRNRYDSSDSRLEHIFTETIEEEDSNFEDSDAEEPRDHLLPRYT